MLRLSVYLNKPKSNRYWASTKTGRPTLQAQRESRKIIKEIEQNA
jgi:hypothetical protein